MTQKYPDILEIVARETGIPRPKVESTVKLLTENTVPFIARYRKEVTGELDEVQIRQIEELYGFYRNLEQRKAEVIRLIDEQGKMTPELQQKITSAVKPSEVEDLYLPFRPKRRTRAGMAREKGLEPLADYLLAFPEAGSPEEEAGAYLADAVPSAAEALQGAMDIVAERVAEDAGARGWVREHTRSRGWLVATARKPEVDSVYRDYYDYREPPGRIVPHRILAINRGEREEFLGVRIEVEQGPVLSRLNRLFVKESSATSDLVKKAVADAYKRLIAPAVERDIRGELTSKAEVRAVQVFSKNLRSLLLQPPVRGRAVLGVDPAYRTGCKWAVVSDTGKLLEVGVVYPNPPHKKIEEARTVFERLVKQYQVQFIVIGNGTASRETEQFVAEFISATNRTGLSYTIVSEAGASVYSASRVAAGEFPDLEASERGAVSIARRVLDPLAELVKIEPRAVGIGQYQHDVPPRRLNEKLKEVVESVVNYVGVDLNTASASLLSYVAGINATLAENIVRRREEIERFKNRRELSGVPRLGPKTMEQCAGFLRIRDGENPLDATAIHPESYELTWQVLELIGASLGEIGSPAIRSKLARVNAEDLAAKLGAGAPTLQDILDNLARPGRDPREDLPPPVFRTDVLSIEDLRPGMELKGTVRNVVDFGAFVDIGVKNDGLVHVSELSDSRVRHPLDVVAVGDVVKVRVLSVDAARGRVALSRRS